MCRKIGPCAGNKALPGKGKCGRSGWRIWESIGRGRLVKTASGSNEKTMESDARRRLLCGRQSAAGKGKSVAKLAKLSKSRGFWGSGRTDSWRDRVGVRVQAEGAWAKRQSEKG